MPAAPGNLRVAVTDSMRVFTWNTVSNVQDYFIQIGSASGSDELLINTNTTPDDLHLDRARARHLLRARLRAQLLRLGSELDANQLQLTAPARSKDAPHRADCPTEALVTVEAVMQHRRVGALSLCILALAGALAPPAFAQDDAPRRCASIRRIYVDKMDNDLDQYIRAEIQKKFPGEHHRRAQARSRRRDPRRRQRAPERHARRGHRPLFRPARHGHRLGVAARQDAAPRCCGRARPAIGASSSAR